MIALSIKQPWAFAILRMGKDIENRKWSTNFRGRFHIHAGLQPDLNAPNHILLAYWKAHEKKDSATLMGGIIGSVEVSDCVKESNSEWFFGPIGFVLQNPQVTTFKKIKGKLGFFQV